MRRFLKALISRSLVGLGLCGLCSGAVCAEGKFANPRPVPATRAQLLKSLKLPADFDIDAYASPKPPSGDGAGALLFLINLGTIPATDGTLQELRSTGLYKPFVTDQRECASIHVFSLRAKVPQSRSVASSCYTAFEIANLLENMGDDTIASLCIRAHLFGDRRRCKSETYLYELKKQYPAFLAFEDAANEDGTFPEPDDIFDAGEPAAQALASWDSKHKPVAQEIASITPIKTFARAARPDAANTRQISTAIAPPHGNISCPCGWGDQPK